MDLGSVFVVVALALLVGIFIAQPFMKTPIKERLIADNGTAYRIDHERSSLLAERDRLLTALQELEFDQALGKIPAEDYPVQRMELLQSGAEVLRKLDVIDPQASAVEMTAEDRVEAAVAARRADAIKRPGVTGELDDLDLAINARRRDKQEKSAGFCPKCGNVVQKSDVFCSRCGTTL